METTSKFLFLTKEEFIEKLIEETLKWSHFLSTLMKVIQYYASGIGPLRKNDNVVLSSQMSELSDIVQEWVSHIIDMEVLVKKHLKDINNLRECDEVDSEEFYLNAHNKLKSEIEDSLLTFYKIKLQLKNNIGTNNNLNNSTYEGKW